CQQYSDFLLTF
nr:immunoglobulin light chain junction region [Macaca mulatta]MOV78131.1 immunoglobulin light chain junction region [Macaca mulatta]MOV78439.1 immunoglobulin light chain junction region [Macaca mulatta]MOV78569.1 immunoglobulin light chain junction region [Macaca mulatta]MOV78753.1 immunoglobulin light chain junction region [Macaca mulatta]